MQNNNQRKPKSRCMYCGSTNYGKGCRYGPKNVHFHADDPTKCGYCGSPNYGRGCKVNPFSDLHVHGVPFNRMFTEQVDHAIIASLLLFALQTPIKEYPAYRLGLIDENGNKIAEAKNDEQKNALSDLTQLLLRLKRFLGPKLDILQETVSLQQIIDNSRRKLTEEQVKMRLTIEEAAQNLLAVVCEGLEAKGLSLEDILYSIRKGFKPSFKEKDC